MLTREMFCHKFYLLDGGGAGGGGDGGGGGDWGDSDWAGMTTVGYGAVAAGGEPTGADVAGLAANEGSYGSASGYSSIESALGGMETSLAASGAGRQDQYPGEIPGQGLGPQKKEEKQPEGESAKEAKLAEDERRLTRQQARRRRSLLGQSEEWTIYAPGKRKVLLGQ
jgi:hypothetical protein